MSVVSMKSLLESGVHFGHRTHKWNPHMKPYIFTERNGIHIIDLQKTVKMLDEAYALVRDTVAEGGVVLFVGTKRQAHETIMMEAERCGMPWVTNRWLGGTLTNWRTIRSRINELEKLERMRDRGDFARLTKREALGLTRQIERLEMLLGGIRNMATLPDLLFVVDVRREETAVHEANLLGIPIVAMVDTNCEPGDIDYLIPSNDDAIRAIKLIVGKVADAVLEGKALRKDEDEEMARAEEGYQPEADLTEEELLGEATLAKLQAQRDVHEVADTEEEEVEEVEEAEDEAEPQAEAEEEAVDETEADVEAEEEVEEDTEEDAEEEPEDEPVAESESEEEDEPADDTEAEDTENEETEEEEEKA